MSLSRSLSYSISLSPPLPNQRARPLNGISSKRKKGKVASKGASGFSGSSVDAPASEVDAAAALDDLKSAKGLPKEKKIKGVDKRKNNKGASERKQYTYWEKSEALLKLLEYQKDKAIKNPYARAAADSHIAVSTLWK